MSKYKIFGSTTQELKLPQDKPQYNLDLVNSQSIPPEYTFTRNSAGTYVGVDGLIKTAAANEPRFDYDPVTGEFKGLLVEEARANLITYSEDLDNAAFDKFSGSLSANVDTSPARDPAGDQTADKWIPNTTDNFHYIRVPAAASTQVFTYSVYAKQAGYRYLLVNTSNGATAGNSGPLIDLQEGVVVDNYNVVYPTTITDAGNGWWRIAITFTGNGSEQILVDHNPFPTSSIAVYAGNGTSGVYLWGVQLEAGSFPTSYIPTSGSTVTRQPDQLILNKPFNSLGTFFVESTPTTGTTLSADNGTSSLAMSSAGKEALYYNTNRTLRMSSDSTPILFNTTPPPQDLNRVSLGFNRLNNSNYINGYLKKFMYYGSPVTEDNLRSLTGNILDTYRSDETIVTNGLVLNLDAAAYTDGTTWTDLSGNGNNGTLVNGVGYDSANRGSLVFDGVDDHVTFPNKFIDTSAGITVDVWFKTSSTTKYQDIFDLNDAYGVWIVINYDSSNRINAGFKTVDGFMIYDGYEINKWYNIILSGSGSSNFLHINGVQVSTGNQTVRPNINLVDARIGNVDGNRSTEYLIGNVASLKFYNRALTPQEIQQNFNALRGRFGI